MDDTATVTEPSSETAFINPDGSYKDGWKDALLPEEMRGEKFYDSPFNANVKELLKTAGNQAKMLGKKGIVPVTEKSNEFEVKEYRRAMGVPDKYDYEKPDIEMLKDKDDILTAMLEKWNGKNMTQDHVSMVTEDVHNLLKTIEAQKEAAKIAKSAEQDRQVLAEENTEYEVNSHYIDNAVGGSPRVGVMMIFCRCSHPRNTRLRSTTAIRKSLCGDFSPT